MVNELTVLASIHILAAAFWVGGAFFLNLTMLLAARSGDPANMGSALRLANLFGLRVFFPLAVIVLASGIWLTEEYFGWDQLWIVLGLIGLASLPRSGSSISARGPAGQWRRSSRGTARPPAATGSRWSAV